MSERGVVKAAAAVDKVPHAHLRAAPAAIKLLQPTKDVGQAAKTVFVGETARAAKVLTSRTPGGAPGGKDGGR
jgi:hypothetical protein